MSMFPISIAIDGPAGSGKSTVAKMVAERLQFVYVDTGAMYRAVAYLCMEYAIDAEDFEAVGQLLHDHDISFRQNQKCVIEVYVDGLNVTSRLRDPDVSARVSAVSTHQNVRDRMTHWQREYASEHSVVMDGRDIGTVVLPNATVKVFLTASPEERARRRQSEYSGRGFQVPLTEIVRDVVERDRRDSERAIAPLMEAHDAVHIDSTGKPIDRVVAEIISLAENTHVR